jgi:hypothetical protein
MLQGEYFDGIVVALAVREAGAHHAGEGGYERALLQIKFLDDLLLPLGRHLAFLRHARLGRERGECRPCTPRRPTESSAPTWCPSRVMNPPSKIDGVRVPNAAQ